MKFYISREMAPFISASMLLTAICFSEYIDEERGSNNILNYDLFPRYVNSKTVIDINDKELIVLPLANNDINSFDIVKTNDIEDIVYSDDKTSVTIYLKDSEIYYSGYYNMLSRGYIYTKVFSKNKVYSKSN